MFANINEESHCYMPTTLMTFKKVFKDTGKLKVLLIYWKWKGILHWMGFLI